MPNNNGKIYQLQSLMSGAALNAQSILDVFVLQNLMTLEDAEKLKANFTTNRQIEEFLIKNRILSRDSINKAYSILLKLPFIGLKNVEIPEEAKQIITKNLALKYNIIPFGLKNNVLRLAISRPADVLSGFATGLAKIFDQKKLGIELFITGESDFREALEQYGGKKADKILMKQGSLPIISLKNTVISDKYLKKIPLEQVKKYHLIVFDQNVSGEYLVACEQPDSSITRKVLDFIQKANNISMELFATSKEDMDYVIKLYEDGAVGENKTDEKQEEKESPPVKKEKPKKEESFDINNIFKSFKKSGDKKQITVDYVSDEGDQDKIKNSKYYAREAKNKEKEEASTKSLEGEELDAFRKEGVAADDGVQPSVREKNSAISDASQSEDVSASEGMRGSAEEFAEDIPIKEEAIEAKSLGALLSKEITSERGLQEIIKEGYVPKMVAAILSLSLFRKSSDIHVEPQTKSLRVRFRIDGILTDIAKLPLKYHPPIISRIKIMSRLKIDEGRIPQDGRFDVTLNGRSVDVRVSSLPTVHGEKLVLRLLDKDQKILSLEDLGMKGSAFDKTVEAISNPWGVILSTGPTGSGKSTTLNAIIARLNQPGVNIITLEDPVEYETPGVNQCQVKPDIGFTFASGLRSVLRQDPNVIMVGEVRDAETAGMVVHAALTGHLVLSTLHTNDTSGTLPRLINMGIEPFLITSAMDLIIAQRLVRVVCPKCREELKLPPKIFEQIKKEISEIQNPKDQARITKDLRFFYGRGCSECSQGYKGRVGLFEVMTITPEVEDLAINRRSAGEIKNSAVKSGMLTMKQDGILKALEGTTTIDEVFRTTLDK